MKNIRRHAALSVFLAVLSPALLAGVLPGTDGKLDFGIEDLPIPDPVLHNATLPRTVQLIVAAATAETTPLQRAQLLTELGECRSPQALPALIAALTDKDSSVRASAAAAIAIAGADESRSQESRKAILADAQLIGKLQAAMSDAEPEAATAAFRALVALQGDTSPAIETAIKSNVPAMLLAGLEASARPEHAKAIVGRLDSVPSPLRSRAIAALGRCNDQSHAQLLIGLANGKNVQEAVAACQALAMLRAPAAAGDMEKLTGAAHATIRREAMRAFGQCSPDRRVEVATARLKDDDPTVRQAAVEVIGANLTPASVASIVPQLSTEYKPLYLATRQALISAKDDATRESCIQSAGQLIEDASPRRQEDGSYVLGHYRSPHMLERHIQLVDFSMERPDWLLIQQASLSLGRIGRQEARPALVKLVLSRDKLIAADPESAMGVNAAIIGAGRLGATEILKACDRILAEDPLRSDSQARMAAAFAIGVAGTKDYPGTGRLFSSIHNPMDAAKAEAIKAIGNLKIPNGHARIKEFPGSESHEFQWLIQWTTARVTGEPEQHPPTVYPWKARTTINDITGS